MDDLERWTRVLPLGAGAFGEVHLAWDRTDARWVALKRFTGQDELGLLRFVIESRIRVRHPHLVRTLAFRLMDDRAWLVTELARGGSVRALMSSYGALPVGWVTEAVDQVLQALEALHATGVVHRDLKPANLLLRSYDDQPPHLLVGDFGIATWRTVSMTGIGAAIGTPGYLAPEYLDGAQPSPATDLFAVGVLAAELLSGRRLVHYSNASPDMPSSWTHTVPLPDEVPGPLAVVLTRMADPDPTRRYTDCAQAREALLRAAPPGSRTGLTVPTPDLLASVPPGWTAEGPEVPTTHLPQAPTEPRTTPPIDGGPTALLLEAPAAPETPTNGSPIPSGSATSPPAPASGSATQPPTGPATHPSTTPGGSATSSPESESGSATQPSTGLATQPPGSASGSATSPPASASGSSTQPPTGSATQPPTGSATHSPATQSGSATDQPAPSSGSATSSPGPTSGSSTGPPAPASGSSTQPPTGSATHPPAIPSGSATNPPAPESGSSTQPPTGSATQPPAASSGSATSPSTPPSGSSTYPPTPPSGSSTQPPSHSAISASGATQPPPPQTPPRGNPKKHPKTPNQKKPSTWKRKLRRATLLLIALLLTGAAGTLWWAATHREVPGTATAAARPGEAPPSQWTPEIVEPCSMVDIAQMRANNTERCQRTRGTTAPQSWVKAPPGGFPVKSDPNGPFVTETCVADGDTGYSPVGEHLYCENKTWTVIA